MTVQLKYGIDANGNVLHIKDVQSGLNCNCNCPECKTRLIAKKGEKKQHHFAHLNGKECKNAPETALHKLAKQIICENSQIYLAIDNIFQYDDSYPEQSFDSFTPDVTISNNKEKIFIEVVVTNDISQEKEEKLKNTGIRTLVIDLSKIERNIEPMDLKKEVLENCDLRRLILKEEAGIKEVKSSSKNLISGLIVALIGFFLVMFLGKKGKGEIYMNNRYSKLNRRK